MRLPKLPPWQRILWAAIAVQTLSLIAFQAGYILIPYFIQDLGVTDLKDVARWTGLYQSVGAITFAVFTPLWGALGDRYGRKANLVRATVGTAVVMALTALVRTPIQLIILRGLQGVVTGTPSASMVLVAASVPRKNLATSLGLLQTSLFVGISIGPMIGGWTGDAIGYRNTFIVSSLIVVIAIFVAMFCVKEPEADEEAMPEQVDETRSRNPFAGFGEVTHNLILASLVLVTMFINTGSSVTSPALPILVQEIVPAGRSPASVSGTITGVGSITAAIAALLVGQIIARLGNRRTAVLGLLGTTLLYVPMGLSQTPLALAIYSGLQGMFRGGIGPSLSAMLVDSVPKDRTGVALGLNSGAGSVGFALGPMLGAAVVAGASTRMAYYVSAALLLLVTAGTSIVSRRAEARQVEVSAALMSKG